MKWLDRTPTSLSASLLVLALAGCSDDGLAPPAADTGAASVSTSSQGTGGGTSNDSSDPGGSDTGPTGPSDDTTGGSGTTGPADSGESGGTGAPASTCESPDDCVLVNDCCQCAAAHVDDVIPECPMECLQPMCDALGLFDPEVTCGDDGTCELGPFNCLPDQILCDSPTPRCPPGTLPGVTPEGDCWTGSCVPVEACDSVPDCEACSDDHACVTLESQVGPILQCQAIPDECAGVPTCACMPPDTCTAPYDTCSDQGGAIVCSCPVC